MRMLVRAHFKTYCLAHGNSSLIYETAPLSILKVLFFATLNAMILGTGKGWGTKDVLHTGAREWQCNVAIQAGVLCCSQAAMFGFKRPGLWDQKL